MFGVKNNEENGKYIRSCSVEEVTFLGVKAVKVNDKDAIEFTMCVAGEEGNKSDQKFNLFFSSEKGAEISNAQIKGWLNRTCSQEYFDQNFKDKGFDSIDSYANALNAALSNKQIRILFGGREYINKENEVKVAPTLIAFDSCEAVMHGCVKPVVPKEESKLVFNKMNQYHFKALEGAPVSTSTMVKADADAPAVEDDLPF